MAGMKLMEQSQTWFLFDTVPFIPFQPLQSAHPPIAPPTSLHWPTGISNITYIPASLQHLLGQQHSGTPGCEQKLNKSHLENLVHSHFRIDLLLVYRTAAWCQPPGIQESYREFRLLFQPCSKSTNHTPR